MPDEIPQQTPVEQTPESVPAITDIPDDPIETPESTTPVLTVPQSAMAQIKAAERERGRKLHQAEMNKRARELGFTSWEEMEAEMKRRKERLEKRTPAQQTTRTAAPKPKAPGQEPAIDPNDPDAEAKRRAARRRERERVKEQLRSTSRARAAEERKRKEAEKRVAALEVEIELRTAAIRAGVADPDYALELLRRDLRGKTAEQLKGYDASKFFSTTLKTSHPYLFGVTETPAHTAPTATPATATAPSTTPSPVDKATPDKKPPLDARKLSNDEYNALLKKHGLTNPSSGF